MTISQVWLLPLDLAWYELRKYPKLGNVKVVGFKKEDIMRKIRRLVRWEALFNRRIYTCMYYIYITIWNQATFTQKPSWGTEVNLFDWHPSHDRLYLSWLWAWSTTTRKLEKRKKKNNGGKVDKPFYRSRHSVFLHPFSSSFPSPYLSPCLSPVPSP